MSVISEFKSFISKGNVLDLAIGVMIGAAFGKIITSLVSDIIMPILGVLLGQVNLTALSITFGEGTHIPVKIAYGNFLQAAFDFLIIASALFMVVRAINKFKKQQEEIPVPMTVEESLLSEIRDILKLQSNK